VKKSLFRLAIVVVTGLVLSGCGNPAGGVEADNPLIGTWREEETEVVREYWTFTADTVVVDYYQNDTLWHSEGPYKYAYDGSTLLFYEDIEIVHGDTHIDYTSVVRKEEYALDKDTLFIIDAKFVVIEGEIRYIFPITYQRWPGSPG
jgi:hypothetical protein